jgi:phenylacetate-CoA ligase
MNCLFSKYFFYYPSTLVKGELVALHLPAYRKFQYIPYGELESYQAIAMSKLLAFCTKSNPFYRTRYENLRQPYIENLDSVRRLPTISKADLLANNKAISATKGLFSAEKTTGGSTGEPVSLYKTPDALARERAATWRAYEWAGVSIGDPQARFWGVPHSASGKWKARVIDLISNRIRVSAFNLSEESFFRYYQQVERFQPAYLYGYVSVINQFAQFCEQNNYKIPSLKCVIVTSEILTPLARSNIEGAFGVKVFNEYGCGEVGSIAHECEYGSMHIMADNLLVETDSPKGEPGEVIVTDFYNHATPLIRYRLGDFATITDDHCSCGRTLPVLKDVHGRAYDLIKSPSGKSIHPESLIYVFEQLQSETLAFRQFQAVQTAIDEIVIKLIPSESFTGDISRRIVEDLQKKVDPNIRYRIHICDSIQRERSGKMRLVKGL